ncbi:MAG: diadenylate cyclase CdaA [Oscillospiraceae bacterium]|nr:diadenylate cyclase CdaA [Oscillospiraceae bacterium]
MEHLSNALYIVWRFVQTLSFADYVDIAIITYVIYRLLLLLRKARSGQLARGLLFFFVALWLSSFFKLTVINFLLNRAVEVGLLALVIIFQPEIRRFFEKIGSGRNMTWIFRTQQTPREMEETIAEVVAAFRDLSRDHTGALVVFERDTLLDEMMKTGVMLDSSVNRELVKNIFYTKAPLHDGAMIIRQGRITAAGCMLPMSQNPNLSRDLGMRHRAGIGMSEQSDAVVAIVSEETGVISVAVDGMLRRHLAPETLERLLKMELLPEEPEDRFHRSGLGRGLSWVQKRTKRKSEDDSENTEQ